MSKQLNQFTKVSLMVISLFVLAACSSTSDTDDMEGESTAMGGSSASNASTAATASAAGNSGQLTQEEIRQENALRQTVFYFDFDIAEFKAADRETLTYHARNLASNSSMRIRLEGHADERGTREYNLALGERRANSILNYLIVNGASRSQIEVVSYGEERPTARGQSDQVYSRNRRVEVVVR
ncbi:MAG: peptidoglycan-associated lipoprotein [Pseudohongiellaceae bacterium]